MLTAEEFAQVSGAFYNGAKLPDLLTLSGCPEPYEAEHGKFADLTIRILETAREDLLSEELMKSARNTGLWFYWRYACALATAFFETESGEHYGDRSRFKEIRERTFLTLLKMRFGIYLGASDSLNSAPCTCCGKFH